MWKEGNNTQKVETLIYITRQIEPEKDGESSYTVRRWTSVRRELMLNTLVFMEVENSANFITIQTKVLNIEDFPASQAISWSDVG